MKRASWFTVLAYGAPMFGLSAPLFVVQFHLLNFGTDVLGIAPAVMGVLLAAFRVWDALSDPIAGWLSARALRGLAGDEERADSGEVIEGIEGRGLMGSTRHLVDAIGVSADGAPELFRIAHELVSVDLRGHRMPRPLRLAREMHSSG